MKKRILSLILVLVMVVGVFAACVSDDPKKPSKPKGSSPVEQESGENETPDANQYINTFSGAWPKSFDPDKGSDMYGFGVLINTLEPLIRVDEDKSGKAIYVPAGAESWEESADHLSYTFKIRKDMKWTDGEPLNAHNYADGIRRAADPATASDYANMIVLLKNGIDVLKGEKPVDQLGVEVPDDHTLVIHLNRPCAYFVDIAIQRVFFPIRKDLLEQHGEAYSTSIETIPICGPYKIESWTVNNELNYVKNEDYWNAANVRVEKINVKIIQDENTINTMLSGGEIDYASVNNPEWQSKLSDEEFNITKNNGAWTAYWIMNYGEKSAVANPKICRAINAVLDRKAVIDVARHGARPAAYSFVPPTVTCQGTPFTILGEGPALDLKNEIKDPKALFEEGVREMGKDPAGYTIRLTGSDESPQGRLAIEAYQQQLETALGCKVVAKNLEWNAFMSEIGSKDYDIVWLAWSADFNDPANFLETAYSKTMAYPTGWKNEKYDELIEKAINTTDAVARAKYLHEAEKILVYEDSHIIPIEYSVNTVYRRKYIRGAKNNNYVTMGFQTLYTVGRE